MAVQDAKEEVYDQNAAQGHTWTKILHLVPELVVLHPLHIRTWNCLSVIVAATWCLESMVKVQELRHFLCNSNVIER